LTVGINPSEQEFKMGRCWEVDRDDPTYLLYVLGRLKNYFSLKIDPHDFFKVWEAGLNHLDIPTTVTRPTWTSRRAL